jgi:hypothetical protein
MKIKDIKKYCEVAFEYFTTPDYTYENLDARKRKNILTAELEDLYGVSYFDFLDTLLIEAKYGKQTIEQVIEAYKAMGYEVE